MIVVGWVLCLCLSYQTQAADIRDQLNVQTGKAELVIPDMQPQDAANKIKDALSQFAIPANLNFRTLPSDIPARPDEPVAKQTYVQGAPAIDYQCPTAYAEITKRPPPVKNAFYYNAEMLQACLYSFQKGVKVYLIFTVATKTESLTSGLFNGITKAIRGTDGERITRQLNENIADIKKNIPSLLVEKLEAPGMPFQEPDKEAVAALIPAKTVVSPQQVTALAPAPSSAPANNNQVKVDARKNLTAMGMTYHSQEQFLAAVRRKDDVAVQLYLDGGGIDPNAREKNGKTPVEIAQEVGAVEVAKIISEKINKPATNTPSAASVPRGLSGNSVPSASDQQSYEMAKAGLSPEMVAQLNAKIDALDLSPEQKEVMRVNAIRQIGQVKAFASRINQETGEFK